MFNSIKEKHDEGRSEPSLRTTVPSEGSGPTPNGMKKTLLLIVVIGVIVVAGAVYYDFQQTLPELANANSVTNSSKTVDTQIIVEPEEYDFGRVKYGDVVEYTFKVKNVGNNPLTINGITTSCGCTTADMAQKEIKAAESSDLIVRFDPAVHEDDTDIGQLTRTVYLATSDPLNQEVEVKIYADVYK